ncbi:uncharacterized protein [Watersipora subatra]|uniref:uncharacterized protein n=1 Tax=Watersipora subatra TaxID=2589382 RepID=UPI00355B8EE4
MKNLVFAVAVLVCNQNLICGGSIFTDSADVSLAEQVKELSAKLKTIEKDIQTLSEVVVELVQERLEKKPEAKSHVRKREIIGGDTTDFPFGMCTNQALAHHKVRLESKSHLQELQHHQKFQVPGAQCTQDGEEQLVAQSLLFFMQTSYIESRSSHSLPQNFLIRGFAGVSSWDQPGGGTDYQCMPEEPQFNKFYSGPNPFYSSTIAGVEYHTHNFGIFPSSTQDQNAPCARCYTNNRPAQMMIPAKRECLDGWTKEYEGYLMSERDVHGHQTTYECVDENPEYVKGQEADINAGFFFFVRPHCARGVPCPPYENKALTCVVCSK